MTPLEKDCQRFGLDPKLYGGGNRDAGGEAIPVWPDMKPAWALFCDAPWQWVPMGMAGSFRSNIKRGELEACARAFAIELTPAISADVRIMEEEALRYWSSKR